MKRREFIRLIGGAAAAWPVAVGAQQSTMQVVGFLDSGSPRPKSPYVVEFLEGLAQAGYFEGQNVAMAYRGAENQDNRLPSLATDLVRTQVAVIVATGSIGPAMAAKAATSTIPIVFALGADPVKYGLVESLNRPGGNVTGISFNTADLTGKRFELLCEIAPQATKIAYLSSGPDFITFEEESSAIKEAAKILQREVVFLEARVERDVEAAFATLVHRRAGALIVGVSPPMARNSNKILALAAPHKIPAIYAGSGWTAVGGLMSYGPDFPGLHRQLAVQYVARILKGEKSTDLPVQRPTRFRFVLNLKTAKAIGLEVPPMILARADEVIE